MHIKTIIHYVHLGFIHESQGWFNIHSQCNASYNINKIKDKTHMMIWIHAGKTFDKIQRSLVTKSLNINGASVVACWVKPRLTISASLTGCWLESWQLHFTSSIPAHAYPGRQQVVARFWSELFALFHYWVACSLYILDTSVYIYIYILDK